MYEIASKFVKTSVLLWLHTILDCTSTWHSLQTENKCFTPSLVYSIFSCLHRFDSTIVWYSFKHPSHKLGGGFGWFSLMHFLVIFFFILFEYDLTRNSSHMWQSVWCVSCVVSKSKYPTKLVWISSTTPKNNLTTDLLKCARSHSEIFWMSARLLVLVWHLF